ncbi:ITA10 protein, partial [Pomatorhinus ruficollis]|nr:ITA10 protein [Pomatorhinus ruficollis]
CPSRLLVGAPWDGNGQGDIYKCGVGLQNSSCAKANLGAAAPWLRSSAGHLGMTLVDSKDGGFVVCAPLWSQECGTSVAAPWGLEGSLWTWGLPVGLRHVPVDLGLPLALTLPFQVGVLQYGERLVQEWALGQHPTAQRLLEAARNLTRQEGRETRTAMAIRQA